MVVPEYAEMYEEGRLGIGQEDNFSLEYKIDVGDKVKWVFEKQFAIRGEQGEVTRLSGVYSDISERKFSEESTQAYLHEISELKRSLEIREEQYRGLIENALDIIYELDENGKPTYINQVSEPLIGYTNEELYQKHFWELIPQDHAEEYVAKYVDLIKRKVRNSYLEVPIQKKSGEIVWLGQNTTVFFNGDWLYKASVIARDITIQRQNEDEIQKLSEFQQKILDGTDYGFITTSHPDGIITSFNKGAEAMLGYQAEEVIDKYTTSIFHDHTEVEMKARELTEELGMPISAGVDVFHTKVRDGIVNIDVNEWTYVLRDGSRITVELSLTALRDKNDEVTGYLGIAKDITQRKKTELELIQAKEEAEVANEAKSEFLANMSHEIRTPLNGIIGFTDLLIKSDLNETQSQHLGMVSQSADVLLDIINDVLDFSKIEAGKLKLELAPTNIQELCRSVVQMTSPQSTEKGLEQLCSTDDKVPNLLLADELRLRQVLVNLLSNAVKFTQKGSVELKVDCLGSTENGMARLRFSVTDSGIGIAPNDQDKILEAFQQVDSSTTKRFGGTGLGLTISNNLLKLMDSEIRIESEVGVGSRFYFDLILEPVAENREVSNPIKRDVLLDLEALRNREDIHILIAEDNPVNLQVIKFILKKILPQIQITEAKDGKETVTKFQYSKPSMVFMDIQMPEINGYDATTQIRTFEASISNGHVLHTPIIALTAGIIEGEKERCLNAGMDDYMSKPVVLDRVKEVLSKWLN